MKKSLFFTSIFVLLLFSCSEENTDNLENTEPKNEIQKTEKDISFTLKTESVVEVGEIFQIVFEVNENIAGFSPPDFGKIDILSGPLTSTYSSTQIINGKSTKNISNSYTYTASCSDPGEHIIPAAEITLEGHTYKSNSAKIKVIGTKTSDNTGQIKKVPDDDIFISTNFSDTEVYNGEYIIATTKIYTRTDFSNINEVKFPDFKGFWVKTLHAPRQIQFKNELINGKKYSAAVLKQTMIFAQKPGRYEISPYSISIQIKKKDGKGQDFFGNIVDTYKLINKKLSTKKQTITVKPLPLPIPENFSGITGKEFKINANIDSDFFGPDESTNLSITVSGNGNMHLLNDFNLKLPENIESFKPEISDKEEYSDKGAYGQTVFDFVIVAKDQGKYIIDPIEFTYFDVEKEQYNTIRTQQFNLTIGSGISSNKTISDNTQKPDTKDIRYIKENTSELHKKSSGYFGTLYYYLTFLILAILFISFIFMRKKMFDAQADVITVKRNKASKVSQKRLMKANKYMTSDQSELFYKEILNAVWGYLSDKLSVTADQLTNDQITKILTEKNVNEDLIKKLLGVTEMCGFAQYSPDTRDVSFKTLFNTTQSIINQLEEIL